MKKVLITGHGGMAASALEDLSTLYSQYEFVYASHKNYDLRDKNAVADLFLQTRPDYVVHTAARVGGILRNIKEPYDLFYDNILLNTLTIDAALKTGVEKFIGFCSVCIFPDDGQELKEENISNGAPYHANASYAYAKRNICYQIEALKKQYGDKVRNYGWVAPGNIYYFRGDNFNLENSHVLPGLIHRFYLAKRDKTGLNLFGDGSARREFLWMGDAAKCILDLLSLEQLPEGILLCGNEEHSIADIVNMLVEITEFDGEIVWGGQYGGQAKRPSSKTLFNSFFPDFQYTPLKEGLEKTWKWFCENYPNVRL